MSIVGTLKQAHHELFVAKRSPHWHAVELKWIEDHPICSACGGFTHLQVHHVEPFHDDPSRELDTGNLLTLCMDGAKECHLHVGHSGAFAWHNPDVRADASRVLACRRANDMGALKLVLEQIQAKRVR